jgi:hypothetical protein
VWWISTTIFAWWTGNDFDVGPFQFVRWISTTIFDGGLAMIDVGTLSNLCGGYLPPYLHGGLAMILMWEPYPICAVDIYHHICMVDWQ